MSSPDAWQLNTAAVLLSTGGIVHAYQNARFVHASLQGDTVWVTFLDFGSDERPNADEVEYEITFLRRGTAAKSIAEPFYVFENGDDVYLAMFRAWV
jgi:hypothetical protein